MSVTVAPAWNPSRYLLLAALAVSVWATQARAGQGTAVLVVPGPAGPESKAAIALAGKAGAAREVRVTGPGTFSDAAGKAAALSDLAVLWVHQGDSTDQSGPVYHAKSLAALKQFVQGGGGLYLSGSALSMAHLLGVEPADPRRGGPGNDTGSAGLVPLVKGHPVFRGLGPAGRTIAISDRGYPAFADFHGTGGPGGGMLLARSPGGSENPLVEYALGKGRIIAMGWRLPHYSHAANPHRANLEKLTANILAYLAAPKQWQKVVVRTYKPARRRARARGKSSPPAPQDLTPHALESLALAVRDLAATFGPRYPKGQTWLARVADLKARLTAADKDPAARTALATEFRALQAEALLANPLLDFDRLLLVKRSTRNLGLPANWQSNSSLRPNGYDNELCVLSPVRPDGTLTTVYKPEGGRFVGDVDLHWDADRLMFSMQGRNKRWQIHELSLAPAGKGGAGDGAPSGAPAGALRELPLVGDAHADNYDACYLPSGNILFTSTAPCVGVPCVKGSSHVSLLFLYEAGTGRIRQLTFDQDHNWCPTVLPNGRVLYLRWEYSDIPHYVSRILFHMNPDGTNQMEFYGSNSYWPNSMFYARPIPGSSTKFVAVVSGHHDTRRMGQLVLFDVTRGRHEADGAVQRMPGRGEKVEPIIRDGLVRGTWPMYLHPWPLGDAKTGRGAGKYFLVACQPSRSEGWGLYLADVFDNLVKVHELPGYALLEPIPLVPRRRPPVIPDKTQPGRKDALVYLTDVYAGPGLKGVPPGTVKKLRLVTYHFAYHGMGGQVNRVGLDGPWDVKRVIGTVPVEPDGSALFRVPANTPISFQPLDAEGKALQLMRSWSSAMPGEVLSCVGCHEPQNMPVGNRRTLASTRPPAEIAPWYGPTRGFGFRREVQPVLDRYCIRCHAPGKQAAKAGGPDFTDRPNVPADIPKNGYKTGTKFPPSYVALRSYVRAPSIESDMHLLPAMEFHADTTKLLQLLRRGHHGVRLDAESLDRLVTWIDLHAPAHGTWADIVGKGLVDRYRPLRQAALKRYAGITEDPEAIHGPAKLTAPPMPAATPIRTPQSPIPDPKGWPFDAAEAKRRQARAADGGKTTRTLDLGDGVKLTLVRIPAGEFVMGRRDGENNERPVAAVRIGRAFWMGTHEVTNAQFAQFDSSHDSRLEHGDFLQFSVRERGYPVNGPTQPVVRVSWDRARAFCRWLSERTGAGVALPTEAQWEWACRAGTDTPMYWGSPDTNFAKLGNLADKSLHHMDTFGWGLPSGAVPPWRPAIETVHDRYRVTAPVGTFGPNPWGLYDMHGNAAEWTRSAEAPYPYRADDGRNDPLARAGRRVVRGGSWHDRPRHARSAARRAFRPYQGVFDVGFRILIEDAPPKVAAAPNADAL